MQHQTPQQQLQNKKRLIFQVDEGHRSQYTANKYRGDFRHFLDLEVLLDLGKEAIQELSDNQEKKYSRSTVNNRIAAVLYFLDNNDIELNKRKISRYFPSDESTRDDRPYTTEEIQRIISVCDLEISLKSFFFYRSSYSLDPLRSPLGGVRMDTQNRVFHVLLYHSGSP